MCRIEFLDFRKNFVTLTLILTLLVVVSSVLAVGVPQWVTITPNSVSVGLFKQCSNGDCNDITYPVRVGCRSGSEVRDRMSSSAAMLIIATILNAIVAICVFMDIVKCVRMTRYGRFWIFAFSLVAVGCSLITLSIVGDTFDRWLYCGTSFCDASFPGVTCGQGYSYILAIVAAILVFIITVLYCFDTCRMVVDNLGRDTRTDANRTIFLYVTCLVLVASCVMNIIAVSTPEWYVAYQDRVTSGLFQNCVGSTCKANDYPDVEVTTITSGGQQCQRNLKDLKARLDATAAFLFIPIAVSLAIFVMFLLNKCGCIKLLMTGCVKIFVVVLLWGVFVSQMLAVLIYGHTMDSWYYCGISYCEGTASMMGTSLACNKGFAFGMAIVAVVASFLVAVMHLFELNDWACFSNRATAADPFGLKGSAIDNVMSGVDGSAAVSARYTSDGKRIPDGDWDHDAVSGYYWSDAKHRFWDPASGQFYDPDSETWSATCN